MKLPLKPVVLHLCVDFPNYYLRENTLAIKNFIDASSDQIEHYVIALTRTSNPFKVGKVPGDGGPLSGRNEKVISMRYWGLPFGVLLSLSMKIVAWRVNSIIVQDNLKLTFIHAHKLTFEGIAGWYICQKLNLPLVVSIRGESESKILRFKPHYYSLLKKIINYSSRIYYVSAWFKPILNEKFSIPEEKQFLLPNFVKSYGAYRRLYFQESYRFISILDLNVYKKKGLDRLLLAFKVCLKDYPQIKLDIVGRSSPQALKEVMDLINNLDLNHSVSVLGVITNEVLQVKLPEYTAMLLPSHNETFGMVYVEALLAGTPILFSKNTGIDGFLDSLQVGVAVNPLNVEEISLGIKFLIKHDLTLHQWLESNRAQIKRIFDKSKYVIEYKKLTMDI